MVSAFEAHVVGRMEVKEKEFLAECESSEELKETMRQGNAESICNEGDGGIDEEEKGDCRMLEIVEMLGRYGPILGEGLVVSWTDEKLRSYGEERAENDAEKLAVFELSGRFNREPRHRLEMAR